MRFVQNALFLQEIQCNFVLRASCFTPCFMHPFSPSPPHNSHSIQVSLLILLAGLAVATVSLAAAVLDEPSSRQSIRHSLIVVPVTLPPLLRSPLRSVSRCRADEQESGHQLRRMLMQRFIATPFRNDSCLSMSLSFSLPSSGCCAQHTQRTQAN